MPATHACLAGCHRPAPHPPKHTHTHRVRDDTLVELGIRLEDKPDGSSVWKTDDPAVLRAEQVRRRPPSLAGLRGWARAAGAGACTHQACVRCQLAAEPAALLALGGAGELLAAEACWQAAADMPLVGASPAAALLHRRAHQTPPRDAHPSPQEERRRAAAEARGKKLRTQLETKRKVRRGGGNWGRWQAPSMAPS